MKILSPGFVKQISTHGIALTLLAGCATSQGPQTTQPQTPSIPSAPVFQMDSLTDATGAELDSVLGAPDISRREGVGEYRRYSLKNCALIIILYPNEQGAVTAQQIDSVALQSGDAKPEINECLAGG